MILQIRSKGAYVDAIIYKMFGTSQTETLNGADWCIYKPTLDVKTPQPNL